MDGLKTEPEAVVITPPRGHEPLGQIVEKEAPLQLGPGRCAVVAAARGRLLVREEFDWHRHKSMRISSTAVLPSAV